MKINKLILSSLLFFALPTFSALADCGNPSFGEFQCDSDSIRVTYDQQNMLQNSWINQKASSSETFVSGPILNLEAGSGAFKSIQVTASLNFQGKFENVNTCWPEYFNYHLFDVTLSATDNSNNEVKLYNLPVYIEPPTSERGRTFGGFGRCVYVLSSATLENTENSSIPIILDIAPIYKNFQIKINNLTLDSNFYFKSYFFPDFNLSVSYNSIKNDKYQWYLQLLGIR